VEAQHRPELVLLDVHLPDTEGGEVLARLRDDPATATIPVIMVSADATQRQVQRFLAAGARAYFTEPLDVRDLLHLARRPANGDHWGCSSVREAMFVKRHARGPGSSAGPSSLGTVMRGFDLGRWAH
jgi:CheY-like chemotaxis protein